MTSLPATQFGLHDRGVLAPGYCADLIAFQPHAVRDRADFVTPHQLSEGIDFVMVNGTTTRLNGRPTGDRAGRFVE